MIRKTSRTRATAKSSDTVSLKLPEKLIILAASAPPPRLDAFLNIQHREDEPEG
jgi:hypothetical protein